MYQGLIANNGHDVETTCLLGPTLYAASFLTHEGEGAENGEAGDTVGTIFPGSALGLQEILGMAAAIEWSSSKNKKTRKHSPVRSPGLGAGCWRGPCMKKNRARWDSQHTTHMRQGDQYLAFV